ncbi:tyrosyl-DNA phosphodiesterase-domain-containing protein [Triangularia setosa]|uniref:Tyrosyl-DNA phosphodiesterase-domain-containing protein n=1 Tax=Triangularia setosa TaxID=2587417 RepID=A0AAN6WD40_9PEZI|nr:tyrosyl-DNA phosphodiesterase-domain-containing protein [Podospora setosa]
MSEEREVIELSGSDTEDEDLRIAIALSLGQDPGSRRTKHQGPHETIDLTLDEESPAAEDAARASRPGDEGTNDRDKPRPAVIPISMSASRHPDPAPTPSSLATGLSALGLDRKKMEEERLARLAQRKRKASPEASTEYSSLDSRSAQRPRTVGDKGFSTQGEDQRNKSDKDRSSLAVKVSSEGMIGSGGIWGLANAKNNSSFSSLGHPHSINHVSPAGSSPSNTQSSTLPFPRGVVKKTWIYPSYPRVGDDIKIEEVLQKDFLELAVISSFQWDEDWMLSKIDISRTKLYLVAFANSEAQEEMRNNVPKSRIRFCFPPMQAMGSMHSKLMLLKYEKYMRIVVPTGNFMSYDWGETGTMENPSQPANTEKLQMVFLIDLPKFNTTEERDAVQRDGLTSFGEDLLYFLMAQGVDPLLINSLRSYDFSATRRYGFVHTIVGSHTTDEAWKRTGYPGLGRAVDALGLASNNAIELDYVCATLGAVNSSLVNSVYNACQGDSGLKELENRTPTHKKVSDDVLDHVRVYYPSEATVASSKGGRDGAGTICFQPKWWKAATFPHEVLRVCRSRRQGVVMHSKVAFVRPSRGKKGRGWVYLGSANLSESAW